jgi:hypothetical protein
VRRGGFTKGEARPRAVLKEADVIEIRRRYAEGETLKALHADYAGKCSKVNLHHIVHGRRWAYLLPTPLEAAIAGAKARPAQ